VFLRKVCVEEQIFVGKNLSFSLFIYIVFV